MTHGADDLAGLVDHGHGFAQRHIGLNKNNSSVVEKKERMTVFEKH